MLNLKGHTALILYTELKEGTRADLKSSCEAKQERQQPCKHQGLSSTRGGAAEQIQEEQRHPEPCSFKQGLKADLRQQKASAGPLRGLALKAEPEQPQRSSRMEQSSPALQCLLQPPTASTFPAPILAPAQAPVKAGCIPLLLPRVLSVCSFTSLM